jgi:hypothetical protein
VYAVGTSGVLGSLHCMYVVNVVDVSEVHTASIFGVEMSSE